mgnify:FL=1
MKGRILEFHNTQSKIFITNKKYCTIKKVGNFYISGFVKLKMIFW